MRILLATFALLGMSQAQYSIGPTGTVNLPSNPTGAQQGSTTTQNVVIPKFPTADLNGLSAGTSNQALTDENIKQTVDSIKAALSIPVNSFAALFTKYPSLEQLYKIAINGDIGSISTLIFKLHDDDSVDCNVKLNYLIAFLATVKNSIAKKTLEIDTGKTVIDLAKTEIARLQEQVNAINASRTALYIPQLQSKVDTLIPTFTTLQNQLNTIKAQIAPEEARITGFENEIETYNRQNDGERNKITNDRLTLSQTNSLISDLQKKLQDAKDQKAFLEGAIAKSEATIKDNNAKIQALQNTITDIQAKIKALNENLDRLRRDANRLEVDLERARTDLSDAQSKDHRLFADIQTLNARVAAQKPLTSTIDYDNLKIAIDRLNSSLKLAQDKLDEVFYFCNGAGKITKETNGNTIVYVVKGESFGSYVQTAYGKGVVAPSLQTNADYRLQVINPFSPLWTSKFGVSSSSSGFCGKATNSGSGFIESFSNNGLIIKDTNGVRVPLSFSSCARIEVTKSEVNVGDNIFWAGVESGNGNGYVVSRATCM